MAIRAFVPSVPAFTVADAPDGRWEFTALLVDDTAGQILGQIADEVVVPWGSPIRTLIADQIVARADSDYSKTLLVTDILMHDLMAP
jgi:hypothetical protein